MQGYSTLGSRSRDQRAPYGLAVTADVQRGLAGSLNAGTSSLTVSCTTDPAKLHSPLANFTSSGFGIGLQGIAKADFALKARSKTPNPGAVSTTVWRRSPGTCGVGPISGPMGLLGTCHSQRPIDPNHQLPGQDLHLLDIDTLHGAPGLVLTAKAVMPRPDPSRRPNTSRICSADVGVSASSGQQHPHGLLLAANNSDSGCCHRGSPFTHDSTRDDTIGPWWYTRQLAYTCAHDRFKAHMSVSRR